MSHLGLGVGLITKENIKEELARVFSCVDEDFINEDYIWEEAKALGFKSNLEYCLDNSINKYGDDLEKTIKEVIAIGQGSWSSYYDEWENSIVKTSDGFVVTIATSRS